MQILLEKGIPTNVDLATEVLLFSFSFSFLFFLCFFHFFVYLILIFIMFFYFPKKEGTTPLYVAAEIGYEQIVQILLEKGRANVNSQKKVFSFLFFLNIFFEN